MKKLLFPTDFSPVANHALSFAARVARQLEAKLVVLHAFHFHLLEADLLPVPVGQALRHGDLELATQRAEHFVQQQLRRVGEDISTEVQLVFGQAREQILRAARHQHPDLIIMGTSGASHARHRFFGSVTQAVMLHADCPVLAVPPGIRFDQIKRIGYATDLKARTPHSFETLGHVAEMLGAEVQCVHIETRRSQSMPMGLSLNRSLEPFMPPVKVVPHAQVIAGLKKFIHREHIDLLAMVPHQRYFPQNLWSKSMTRRMVLEAEVPILSVRA